MKVNIVNFNGNFKMRQNKDNSGVISCKRGIIKLNEVGFDQVCALNDSIVIDDAINKMHAIYEADFDVLEADLKQTLSKLQGYGIKHKHIQL
ncbi:PqqD family protein [Vibrio vulnificus]|uniref:PqqD family protein n=1 Tax=Vibrio TaxID=662 RepID=UPI000D651DCA|nr:MULTISPECIES: PqqD family protein [Vibrio]ELA7337566.1 PqqD family protein [Vibrio parahaemolyticus]ELC9716560.1 PqqD family protein [Vibrio vulnificus]ELS0761305.1 PqqD family protein [Vibrio vulnificus]ELV8606489.1 PqqD family protein [Vibrio vulnificus]ELV8615945.1 PqqD family protein [Vibrio vulnificus]